MRKLGAGDAHVRLSLLLLVIAPPTSATSMRISQQLGPSGWAGEQDEPSSTVAALPTCGGATGPGACSVATTPTPNTDSYYVAVFATHADAAPADGSGPRVLTLTLTNNASAVVSGLRAGRTYWFRWRSHNASFPTLARGWGDYGPSFACATGLSVGSSSPEAPRANSFDVGNVDVDNRTKFMYVYRVSEYTDEVDFLTNHNSASEAGQAGFLTNTDSSLFFSFNTTAVSRYCIEYLPSTVPDPAKDPDDSPDFAAYVSCNGPEGRRWGNVPEDPICICDVWSDRMIAHQTAEAINASCHRSVSSSAFLFIRNSALDAEVKLCRVNALERSRD